MNVEYFDKKVRAYIALLPSRQEIGYAARYAHWLVVAPERALDAAENIKAGIPTHRRTKIRKDIFRFNLDGVL